MGPFGPDLYLSELVSNVIVNFQEKGREGKFLFGPDRCHHQGVVKTSRTDASGQLGYLIVMKMKNEFLRKNIVVQQLACNKKYIDCWW